MDFSKNHGFWMALGCLIPILLLFTLPYFGIRGDWLPILFVAAMLACHLMMGGHGKYEGHDGAEKEGKKDGPDSDAGTRKGGRSGCH